ncbi:unnamed protein product, partial [marine sediment metagenome]
MPKNSINDKRIKNTLIIKEIYQAEPIEVKYQWLVPKVKSKLKRTVFDCLNF